MKNEHTPGPWKVAGTCNVLEDILGQFYHVAHVALADDDAQYPLIADVSNRGVYGSLREAYKPSPEQLANARLIAAAPDLLDALERLLNVPEPMTSTEHYDYNRNAERLARAAIAKATGQE